MKYRESGMPSEQLWDTFFDPLNTLKQMEVDQNIRTLIDIGCGYSTFLIPAAQLISGTAIGIDIDNEMIDISKKKVQENKITNIELLHGEISYPDIISVIERYKEEIDYITLFNILHCEEPIDLLKKVHDLLADNGTIGVIHWKREETPRGPSIEIRPKPEMIIDWASKAGFDLKKQVELPPYHFGLIFTKK
ncbi:MAG: methyltransferase type 12 [Clostridiales bacterium GWB2_37_7]|nr:MAG: methyltransferase type 12 [Clostridiales bacterium GWB2_37_7]